MFFFLLVWTCEIKENRDTTLQTLINQKNLFHGCTMGSTEATGQVRVNCDENLIFVGNL